MGAEQNRPGIVVAGVSGRMGRMLVQAVLDSPDCRLVGALEREGHAWIGQDLGTAMGGAPLGLAVTDDAVAAIAQRRGCWTSPLRPRPSPMRN